MNRIFVVFFIFTMFQCEKIQEWGRNNAKEKLKPKIKVESEQELEKWKERLNMTEAEIKELDKKIHEMVRKTGEAGSLSWRIARGFMKAGNYEIGIRLYSQALKENSEKVNSPESMIHRFEAGVAFFDKTLLYKPLNEDLLFETGIAFANASRDQGWEKKRREIAIDIFKQLMVKNPEDTRYPYELALIYFDSSTSQVILEEVGEREFRDTDKALVLLESILRKEPGSVPVRFAKANFLYRLGKLRESENEYLEIKKLLEDYKKKGIISESLDKNESYKNIQKNLKKLDEMKKGLSF